MVAVQSQYVIMNFTVTSDNVEASSKVNVFTSDYTVVYDVVVLLVSRAGNGPQVCAA